MTGELRKRIGRRILNEAELAGWVEKLLGLKMPRVAVCEGHSAPFEYLSRAYFGEKDLVVWAPRGGGKTRLGAVATLLDLIHRPGISVRILGGSLEQSLRMWEQLVPDLERLTVKLRKGRCGARRIALAGGSAAAVLTQSEKAVRGLRVQRLRCDEVDLFDPRVWEAAQLVTRSVKLADGREVAGTVEAFSTCHVSGGLMQSVIDRAAKSGTLIKWCLMEVLERCPKERVCATCPLFEECGGRAKEKCAGFFRIDDAIAMKQRVSREMWETEMMCLRPSARGAVFPHFDPAMHVKEEAPLPDGRGSLGGGVWLGIDFGFNDPFVCLWVERDAEGRVFVIDEYVQSGRTMEDHIEEIASRAPRWGKAVHIGCDPSGASRNDQTARSNIALLKRAGYQVHWKQSRIIDGVEMVRAALCSGTGQRRLVIHQRCQRLVEAFAGYRYPEKGGEIPFKDGTHDHLIDALRYYTHPD